MATDAWHGADPDPLGPVADGIIEHMNDDHADAIALYLSAFRGVTAEGARMVGVDTDGFDVECDAPAERFRFDFESAATMDNIRQLMVDLVKKARAVAAG